MPHHETPPVVPRLTDAQLDALRSVTLRNLISGYLTAPERAAIMAVVGQLPPHRV